MGCFFARRFGAMKVAKCVGLAKLAKALGDLGIVFSDLSHTLLDAVGTNPHGFKALQTPFGIDEYVQVAKIFGDAFGKGVVGILLDETQDNLHFGGFAYLSEVVGVFLSLVRRVEAFGRSWVCGFGVEAWLFGHTGICEMSKWQRCRQNDTRSIPLRWQRCLGAVDVC